MDAYEIDEITVFEPTSPVGARPFLYLAGGLLCLLMMGMVFLARVLAPPGEGLAFPLFIGATVSLTLIALGAFAYAFFLLRSPSRVELRPDGILLQGPMLDRQIGWHEIARVETDKAEWPMIRKELRLLVLSDAHGHKLTTLSESLGDFDLLSERLRGMARTSPGAVTGDARLRKAKRNAVLSWVVAAFMLFACGYIALEERYTRDNLRRLETEGRQVEATIDRHYMLRVTPRLEYSFTAEDGQIFSRELAVARESWERLDGAVTVPVRYVASNPDFSRLLEGETDALGLSPGLSLLVTVAGLIMALLFIPLGFLQWGGRDIDIDRKTGKIRLIRLGEDQ